MKLKIKYNAIKNYKTNSQILDVFIPCHPKDFETLPFCIDSIKKNVSKIKNIYVCSYEKPQHLPKNVNFITEKKAFDFPFEKIPYRPKWQYQQLLKLFQTVTIDKYLVVDADTFFTQPIDFFDSNGLPILFITKYQNHQPYFNFSENFGVNRVADMSYISDFMLFDRNIINKIIPNRKSFFEFMFKTSENCHLSEYELYGNYCIEKEIYSIKNITKDFIEGFDRNGISIDNKVQACNTQTLSIHKWESDFSVDMPEIVLFHKGEYLPFIQLCINQIKHITKIKVTLLTNCNNYINCNVVQIDPCLYQQNIGGELFNRSLQRIFYIKDYCVKNNIKDIISFDNDVLLFIDPLDYYHELKEYKIAITCLNEREVVFGFSYFSHSEYLNDMCSWITETIEKKNNLLSTDLKNSFINEMALISYYLKKNMPQYLELPIINKNEKFNCVFDPASYGQYFGGTPNGHCEGIAFEHHYIGRKILSKKLKPIIIDGKPYVNDIPIANLHIHSKNLKKFMTKI